MRALLSVTDADQDGFVRLVEQLWTLDVELFATPGTREGLARRGVSVDALTVVPGDDPAITGEAATFHPDVFAGILARRDSPDELEALRVRGLGLVDLVVVSVPPFEPHVGGRVVPIDEALAMIDVAGVSLLAAAARNYASVAVASHPSQYACSSRRSSGMGWSHRRPACGWRHAPSRWSRHTTPTCPPISTTSAACISRTT